MTAAEIELKEAAEKATPGPWSTDDPFIVMAQLKIPGHKMKEIVYVAQTNELDTKGEQCERDAAFIALANPATILSLLADLESARRDAERYRWMRENWRYAHGDIFFEGFQLGPFATLDAAIDSALGSKS